uniref:uncharacterized protein isoform X2 n=1 Tax=Myxine glutinosa TaxID=7769 RepID=UPI00358F6794
MDERRHRLHHTNSNRHAFESNPHDIGEKLNSSVQSEATNSIFKNKKENENILSHSLIVIPCLQHPLRKTRGIVRHREVPMDERRHRLHHTNSHQHAFQSNPRDIGEKLNSSVRSKATNSIFKNKKENENILSHSLIVIPLLQHPLRKTRDPESADCLSHPFESFIQTSRGNYEPQTKRLGNETMQVSNDTRMKDIEGMQKIEHFKRRRKRLRSKKKRMKEKIRRSKCFDFRAVEKLSTSCEATNVHDSSLEVKTFKKKKKKHIDSLALDFTNDNHTEVQEKKHIDSLPLDFTNGNHTEVEEKKKKLIDSLALDFTNGNHTEVEEKKKKHIDSLALDFTNGNHTEVEEKKKKHTDYFALDFTNGNHTEIQGQTNDVENAEIFSITLEFSFPSCRDDSNEHTADVFVDVDLQVQEVFTGKTQQSQHHTQSHTPSDQENTSSADGDENRQYCQSGATPSESGSLCLIGTDVDKPSNVAGYERAECSQDLTHSTNRRETSDNFEGRKTVRSPNLTENVAFSSEAKKEDHIPFAPFIDVQEKIVSSTPKMARCSETKSVLVSPIAPARDAVQVVEDVFTRIKQVDPPSGTQIKCELPETNERCKKCWVMLRRIDSFPLAVQVEENTTEEMTACSNCSNAVIASLEMGAQMQDGFAFSAISQILIDLDNMEDSEVEENFDSVDTCHLSRSNPQMQQEHLLCPLSNDNTTEEIARNAEPRLPFHQTRSPKEEEEEEEDNELNRVHLTALETSYELSRTDEPGHDDHGMFTIEETTVVPSVLTPNVQPALCVQNVSGYLLRQRSGSGCEKTFSEGCKFTKRRSRALCSKSNGGKSIATKGIGIGQWTSCEVGLLLQAARLYILSNKGAQQRCNGKNQYNRRFPWKDIARNVKTRTSTQCRLKWFHYLSACLKKKMPSMMGWQGKSSTLQLIKCLFEVKDSQNFEWESISSKFCGVPPLILQNKLYHLKDCHVPMWRHKSISESIEFLHDRILPTWEEQKCASSVEPADYFSFDTQRSAQPRVCEGAQPRVCEDAQPRVCEDAQPRVCEDAQPRVCEDAQPRVCEDAQPRVCEDAQPRVCEDAQPRVCEDAQPRVCEDAQPRVCEDAQPRVCEDAQPRVCEGAQPMVCEGAQPMVCEDAQPRVCEDAQPRVCEGAQPRVCEGAQPMVCEGAQPRVCEGAQPRVCEGAQPRVCEGAQPRVCEGAQPRVCEGAQPRVCEGAQPRVCEGAQPRVCEGAQPRVCEGAQPRVCEGAQPRVCEGAQPRVCEGAQPRVCEDPGAGSSAIGP